jgi:ABC-type glycerol-3-phosphate transport system substrate-binding protein
MGDFMKEKRKLLIGFLALLLTCGFVFSSCATQSTIGGTADPHGLISKAKVVAEAGEEIASYGVIVGIVDSGYEEYAATVSAAEAAGKKITTVVTKYAWFYTKVRAYAK